MRHKWTTHTCSNTPHSASAHCAENVTQQLPLGLCLRCTSPARPCICPALYLPCPTSARPVSALPHICPALYLPCPALYLPCPCICPALHLPGPASALPCICPALPCLPALLSLTNPYICCLGWPACCYRAAITSIAMGSGEYVLGLAVCATSSFARHNTSWESATQKSLLPLKPCHAILESHHHSIAEALLPHY